MKRKLKKFFAVFSVFLCLVSVNLSFFTVGANANMIPSGDLDDYYTIGSPIDMFYYYAFTDSSDSYDVYDGVISGANTYYAPVNSSEYYEWYEGYLDDDIFKITYDELPNDGADVFFNFGDIASITRLSMQDSIVFDSWTDLDNNFNVLLGIYQPRDALGNFLTQFVVDYTYQFYLPVESSLEGNFVGIQSITESVNFVFNSSDYYAGIPLFNRDVLSDELLTSYEVFKSSEDEYSVYLAGVTVNIYGVYSDTFYLNSHSLSNLEMSRYYSMLHNRLADIYSFDEVREVGDVIVFEDISWTDWLVNSVGSFLDFEIIPGLSFVGILGLLVGMSLFLIFLKVFAGG